jgi:hypothetical protein
MTDALNLCIICLQIITIWLLEKGKKRSPRLPRTLKMFNLLKRRKYEKNV